MLPGAHRSATKRAVERGSLSGMSGLETALILALAGVVVVVVHAMTPPAGTDPS